MCGRRTDRQHGQNIMTQYGPAAVSMDPLSLCRHCHPADGAFDFRDTLVHAISPNVFAEVSKEVEKSEIALQY